MARKSANAYKTVLAIVSKEAKQPVSKDVAKGMMREMGRAYVREVQRNVMEGFDANGKKLKRLDSGYMQQKARDLRKRPPRGRFAAQKASDVARFTGQTLRDMQSTSVKASDNGDNVGGSFDFGFKTARSAEVAEHLSSGGREIRGLPPASTSRGRAARKRIVRVGAEYIRSKFKQKGIIIDTGSL